MSRKRRRPFPTDNDYSSEQAYEGERRGGLFGFFRDHGVRETIESIVIAVVLALMFRAYEAEAFIIPTGSMAPTLQGHHMDVECPKCNYRFRTGANSESSTTPPQKRRRVNSTFCPICQHGLSMQSRHDKDHVSNNGDRILVNKFVYDFAEPERFDVIVFKNPNNGKQNFIKRLIGMESENLLIESGDIYTLDKMDDGTWGNKQIVRKPAGKVQPMLQLVDDTEHSASDLRDAGWESRWKQWSDERSDGWQENYSDGRSQYYISDVDREQWLRYRHLIPDPDDWSAIENGELPANRQNGQWMGRIISDYYTYNHAMLGTSRDGMIPAGEQSSSSAHWVGDLAVECDVDIKSGSGVFALDLVEGGAHFTCRIDTSTGQAVIQCNHPDVSFQDDDGNQIDSFTGSTGVEGTGSYKLVFANVDNQLFLWANDRLIELNSGKFVRTGLAIPSYSPEKPGDAEPAGIGAQGLVVNINRLMIYRDVYYSSVIGGGSGSNPENETSTPVPTIHRIFNDPSRWSTDEGLSHFRMSKNLLEPMFILEADQFLPMGDNSPRSSDGRIWDGEKFLPREMLIGRAMITYWPHTLNKPVKYFPNFGRMGFIR